MRKNTPFIVLWILFAVFMLCRVAIKIELWVLLALISIGLSIYLLIKNKMPSKKGVLISVALMIIASVAYLGYKLDVGLLLFQGIAVGIPTLLSSLAVLSVIEKRSDVKLMSKNGKNSFLVSMLIAVGVGMGLAVINTFLMKDTPIDFKVSLSRLMICLNPAIYEEMAGRAIFMAYSLYAVGEEKMNKFQIFTMWFMMCMPHTVAHGYGLIETIILCILFGLPFAILQRKRDIASAMISHGLVDAVRFTIFGI